MAWPDKIHKKARLQWQANEERPLANAIVCTCCALALAHSKQQEQQEEHK